MEYFTSEEKTIESNDKDFLESLNKANLLIHKNTLRNKAEFIACNQESSNKIPKEFFDKVKLKLDNSLEDNKFILYREKEDIYYNDLPSRDGILTLEILMPSKHPELVIDETLRFYTVILV